MRTLSFGRSSLVLIASSMTLLSVAGCGPSNSRGGASNSPPVSSVADNDHAGDDHDDHAHPSEGPHHGDLVELGNEEFHAEIVHDEASGTIAIYLLDSTAKKAVAIDTQSIQVNLNHDGKAEQFNLAASPDGGDTSGKSSRFTSVDKELAADLDLHDVQAQLVVSINGKQYRGTIQHDHDHEEDAHNGHDHD